MIRFNKKCYDRRKFTDNGIRHVDLFYEDGGNPTEDILLRFLRICESEPGAIAVHCKAGLGRTGTNIAAYMIKHMSYTAEEAMAWHRVCRVGSVVGPQQHYLVCKEAQLRQMGDADRAAGGSAVEGSDEARPHSAAGMRAPRPRVLRPLADATANYGAAAATSGGRGSNRPRTSTSATTLRTAGRALAAARLRSAGRSNR